MTTVADQPIATTTTGQHGGVASARNRDMAARTRARVAGICYLITVAGSIPALALERPVLSRAGFVLSNSADTRLVLGGVLDLLTAVACVGTAVALYPLLRQRHPGLALGFVTSRVIEAATIVISVVAILSLVTLHEAAAGATGAERASLLVSGKLLVALHSWTFLLGPGLMPAINALLLGTVMFRTGLVPRIIAVIGLVGAPLLIASATATILGVYGQVSAPAGLAALPVAAWELSLGLWLTIKGLQAKAVPGLASRR